MSDKKVTVRFLSNMNDPQLGKRVMGSTAVIPEDRAIALGAKYPMVKGKDGKHIHDPRQLVEIIGDAPAAQPKAEQPKAEQAPHAERVGSDDKRLPSETTEKKEGFIDKLKEKVRGK